VCIGDIKHFFKIFFFFKKKFFIKINYFFSFFRLLKILILKSNLFYPIQYTINSKISLKENLKILDSFTFKFLPIKKKVLFQKKKENFFFYFFLIIKLKKKNIINILKIRYFIIN
jgi:hypothetical protein